MITISRREFLIRSGSGVTCALIERNFLSRVLRNVRQNDAPLIDVPHRAKQVLFATEYMSEYRLNLGGTDESPPVISWREFLQEYQGLDPDRLTEEELEDFSWDLSRETLDRRCDSDWYIDSWCRSKSPNALAYHYLASLDLGPSGCDGGREAGELRFLDGPIIGSDYLGVHVDDKVSLNLLQHRLNELGERVEIKIA